MRTFASNRRRSYRGSRSRTTSIVMVLVLAWLIIGAIAGGQRHYYNSQPSNCASTGTIAVTILAGPLNYLGMHPRVDNCDVNVPQPSP